MPRVDDRLDIPAPQVGVQLGVRSWVLIAFLSLFELIALGWPLLIPAGEGLAEHSADAPFIMAAILPLALVLVMAQLADGGLDARSLAVLGVLSAVNAVLRPALGAGTAGIEGVFFLLLVSGRVFGPGFGFLLGHISMFASALLTAGVGPWLPFQMMCAGWLGLAAGLLPRRTRGGGELALLIFVGIFGAYAYGFAMNLWFWPWLSVSTQHSVTTGSLDYIPGAPLWDNLTSFSWFTLLSSTGSVDTGRAITTTLGLLILGKPILTVLRRASGMARIQPAA